MQVSMQCEVKRALSSNKMSSPQVSCLVSDISSKQLFNTFSKSQFAKADAADAVAALVSTIRERNRMSADAKQSPNICRQTGCVRSHLCICLDRLELRRCLPSVPAADIESVLLFT